MEPDDERNWYLDQAALSAVGPERFFRKNWRLQLASVNPELVSVEKEGYFDHLTGQFVKYEDIGYDEDTTRWEQEHFRAVNAAQSGLQHRPEGFNYPTWREIPLFHNCCQTQTQNTFEPPFNELERTFKELKKEVANVDGRMRNLRWTLKERGDYDYLLELESVRIPLKEVKAFADWLFWQIMMNLSKVKVEAVQECIELVKRARTAMRQVLLKIDESEFYWKSERQQMPPLIPKEYAPIRVKPKRSGRVEPVYSLYESVGKSLDELRKQWREIYEHYYLRWHDFESIALYLRGKLSPGLYERDYNYWQALQKLRKKLVKELWTTAPEYFQATQSNLENLDRRTIATSMGNLRNCFQIVKRHRAELDRLWVDIEAMLTRRRNEQPAE